MYNEETPKDYSASDRILVIIVSCVVIMVVIAFIVIICGRLDKGGAVVKTDPDKCEQIDKRAVQTIPREWLELNCPNLLEDENGDSASAKAE